MEIILTPFFAQYESLAHAADRIFQQVREEQGDCVTCSVGCADCCHALFDLSLIEALYVNHHFNRMFHGSAKDGLLETANRADRLAHKIKRRAHQALKKGMPETDVLTQLAEERVRCPLLDEDNRCRLYAFRPITCRLYGIPTSIQGAGHTCGRSGFQKGRAYPTVNLDAIHHRLLKISTALVKELRTRNVRMADMLIPVSMALLTVMDEDFLGVGPQRPADMEHEAPKRRSRS